jgi:hypothetical protein
VVHRERRDFHAVELEARTALKVAGVDLDPRCWEALVHVTANADVERIRRF